MCTCGLHTPEYAEFRRKCLENRLSHLEYCLNEIVKAHNLVITTDVSSKNILNGDVQSLLEHPMMFCGLRENSSKSPGPVGRNVIEVDTLIAVHEKNEKQQCFSPFKLTESELGRINDLQGLEIDLPCDTDSLVDINCETQNQNFDDFTFSLSSSELKRIQTDFGDMTIVTIGDALPVNTVLDCSHQNRENNLLRHVYTDWAVTVCILQALVWLHFHFHAYLSLFWLRENDVFKGKVVVSVHFKNSAQMDLQQVAGGGI